MMWMEGTATRLAYFNITKQTTYRQPVLSTQVIMPYYMKVTTTPMRYLINSKDN